MKNDYQNRLREFEYKKQQLQYRELTPREYEAELRRLAAAYGI